MVVGLLKMDRNELGASLTSRQNEKNFLKDFSTKVQFWILFAEMELGVLLYFMVLKSSTWLLHAINVKSICRQSTYPNHSCFTLYICNRARDFNSHLFFKIWKNTSGHVCSTEASNDGTSDNETNRLVVQVVKWGLLWKKKYHERRNPNPKQECFKI